MRSYSKWLIGCLGCLCVLSLVLSLWPAAVTDEDISQYSSDADDSIVVNIHLMDGYGSIEDLPLVLEQINKITKEKINVTVDISFSSSSGNVATRISKNEKLDLILVADLYAYYNNGYLLELDELMKNYGQDIPTVIDEEYLELGKLGGKQYGIARNAEMAVSHGVCMRKDILEKYNIDIDGIQTFEDYEQVLAFIKEKEPDLYGVAPVIIPAFDELGTGPGVLMNNDATIVQNYYETDEFYNYISMLEQWRENGYLCEDDYSYSENRDFLYSMLQGDKLFSYFLKYKPGIEVQETNATGVELVCIELTQPVITSSTTAASQWCIYSKSEHPEEAMQLMNLLYSDSEIMNLLCWGIEGEHYVQNQDGTIRYPDGYDKYSVKYNFNRNWQFQNQYLAHVWEGDSPNLAQEVKDYNRNAVRSIALGFNFDDANVAYECERLSEIESVYLAGFLSGSFDVNYMLPKFIDELEAVGIHKVIAEKQKQLDNWLEYK